ncbi:NUDIX hydrolase [Microbacterium sp. CH12i]|uniref:NUDIX hydrolase n=1 Tax=Microbacterium sp. CH12i TaxID=1479651 RepID=UPI0013621434|nr:NUDIX domain-containing protein [Microbacterium sp. CH12i]
MLVAGTAVLLRETPHGSEVLLIRRPDRGSFAGAWVFPGGIIEDIDRRADAAEVEDAGRAAVRETFEEVGLNVTGLVVLSQWVPPIEAPKRVRTWFFLSTEMHGTVTPSPDEVVDWRWVSPTEALAQHARGEIELVPPTWVTLHTLVAAGDIAGAMAASSDPQIYATHVLRGLEAQTFAWRGDAEHPEGGGGRHRLETGERPWRYFRD